MSNNNRGEKPRKSLLALKRSPIAWSRFSLKVVSVESKDVIFDKIARAVNKGAVIGRDIVVGANSVTRLIEKNRAAMVGVCRDSNHILTDHIIEASRLRNIPIVILPKSSLELATVLRIKRVSCFAVSIELDPEELAAEMSSKKAKKVKEEQGKIENSTKTKKRKANHTEPISVESINKSETIIVTETAEKSDTSQCNNDGQNDDKKDDKKNDKKDDKKVAEKEGITEKSEEEIAALILSACMDDLRDGMIRVVSR